MFFSNKELGNQIAPYFAGAQVCRALREGSGVDQRLMCVGAALSR